MILEHQVNELIEVEIPFGSRNAIVKVPEYVIKEGFWAHDRFRGTSQGNGYVGRDGRLYLSEDHFNFETED